MKIFSGSSNPKLAEKIAKFLNLKMGKLELSRFSNGECRVWIKDNMLNNSAIVVQSFSYPPDQHLVEFCLIVDALKRQGVKRIISVIPWLGYCIQDKVFRPGEPLSSKVVANLLHSVKINRIITLDLHNQVIEGFFDIPFTELFATYTLVDYFKSHGLMIDTVISPDVGALKKSTRFSESFNVPLVVVSKKRDIKTGQVSITGISQKVKGKRILIVDDFISTGGTLIQTAQFLEHEGVEKIYACLTHHFYIPGVQEKIEKSALDMLYITDSIQAPTKLKYKKLKVVSVAGLIGEAITKYK
ncbi:MAG TPA: ribose-phosphate pyrophosphokinase [Candidatus Bathyarchaeia archaeon]|nr:ribose-phosphate pyrophosphokinase [Candidatus Bathyarchaeia archaeon]